MTSQEKIESLLSDANISEEDFLMEVSHGELKKYPVKDTDIIFLQHLMEFIELRSIQKQSLEWVIRKYNLLCVSINNGLFSRDIIRNPNGISILTKYVVSLEEILTKNKISFETLKGVSVVPKE